MSFEIFSASKFTPFFRFCYCLVIFLSMLNLHSFFWHDLLEKLALFILIDLDRFLFVCAYVRIHMAKIRMKIAV